MKIKNNDLIDKVFMKNKILKYFEDSKENLNYKIQLILSLIQSMKEENDSLQEKGKHYI